MSASTSTIESVLVENRVFPPPADFAAKARISGMAQYQALCDEAERDYEGYWARLARENVKWTKPFTQVLDQSNPPFYKWFADGELNASANCLDKHMGTPVENKTAIIFEADGGEVTKVTYKELLARVSQFANALKSRGVQKGDRVLIYMPMTIEGVVAMQACARIGATHSVVFGGFSAKAVQERIVDVGASLVVTSNYQMRGGKELPLKAIVDDAIALGGCEAVKSVLVYERTATACNMVAGRDISFTDALAGQSTECEAVPVNAEHPLFILYTSGSTGKPKGVQHATGGYVLWAKQTFEWTFDVRDSDVFWCTADIGWITGHSYVAYGPLAAGATQIVFEGVPTFPNAGRFWQMIERHQCSIFYTAPTAIRSLIKAADSDPTVHPKNWNLSSLRLLGSVGEPINPEAWMWYHKHVGGERCPIVDTFWQTENGGHMITPLPGATPLVPGSCTLPLPGITAAIVDEAGNEIPNGAGGILVVKKPWPSMIRTIWGDPERFKKSYFPDELKGYYLAGDGAVRSEDRGYFRITGRIDDVLNVSGHRMGTMEIESALVSKTDLVAEAAVVGRPDDLTGEAICAFVVLKRGKPTGEEARQIAAELRNWVAKEIGPIAKPKDIRFGDNLPKTRSGKIMRRLLRSLAKGEAITQDTSTLENPAILEQLSETN
ncbi:AMP-dependent synthetase [Comamonas testosteroni]|uniref:Acetyl-coenzyme A synthetase n=1 Tax=Comamonas testosteroni TaxID=285 RepID=A0A096F6E3_COMTE|nr:MULTISPECIES: acetate--CoA ligase [Comamonas]KGH25308.1 acetyl-CoA synthetase [Comamonas testosteroni]KOC23411.1 AMP-dependent synthetase [Comamonas testosteroni]KWT71504.1 Acetyl-coenzyme A synthetase [Comamonas testosteroni]MDN5505903.1 acetate--CoA ligase [Comamonas sp.]MDN5537026.1 acetate--CoA ligase [Comamonas sp.]